MNDIKIGTLYVAKQKVTKNLLASEMGSGDIEVYATPAMVALMENAAMMCLLPYLEQEETSVGISISTTHTKATALNSDVEAVATITEIDGRKVTFSIIARDGLGIIGESNHERFVLNREKFLSRL